ncbi:MAG: AbrB/MazE/SpoVT family DNA-binding domain-containing protein [Candidatus Omnitrophica bacterium]|nr:AbrB/MazE/SpoVT family DNA-binding domain-containing protein [Candidatus Omnitrophota bacterium]
MTAVTISPKFQVVIPLEVRKALRLTPGEKLQVFSFENRIELIPMTPIKKMRGFLKGIDTMIEREREDRV